MKIILSWALIVPILFVIKCYCEQSTLRQRMVSQLCTDIRSLEKYFRKQWTNVKFVREQGPTKPSTRPTTKRSTTKRPTTRRTTMKNSDESENISADKNSTVKSKIIEGYENIWPFPRFKIPYFVGIHFKNDFTSLAQCGGVLLNRHWILTSESCITKNMFSPFSPNGFIQMPLVVANSDSKTRMGDKPFSKIDLICKLTDKRNPWVDIVLAHITPQSKYDDIFPKISRKSTDKRLLLTVGGGAQRLDDEKDEPHDGVATHSILMADKERCALLLTKRNNLQNMICTKGNGFLWDANAKAKGHSCTNDAGGPVFSFYPLEKIRGHVLKNPTEVKAIISNLDYVKPCLTNHHWRMYSRTDIVMGNIDKVLSAFDDVKPRA